jgi:hypothetical protein
MHQLSRKSPEISGRKSRRYCFYSTEQDLINGEKRCPERKKIGFSYIKCTPTCNIFENMVINGVRSIFFPFLFVVTVLYEYKCKQKHL